MRLLAAKSLERHICIETSQAVARRIRKIRQIAVADNG